MAITLSRRSMLGFLAAPAIIRVADIMPVKALPKYEWQDVAVIDQLEPGSTFEIKWLLDAFEQMKNGLFMPFELTYTPASQPIPAGDEAEAFIYR